MLHKLRISLNDNDIHLQDIRPIRMQKFNDELYQINIILRESNEYIILMNNDNDNLYILSTLNKEIIYYFNHLKDNYNPSDQKNINKIKQALVQLYKLNYNNTIADSNDIEVLN